MNKVPGNLNFFIARRYLFAKKSHNLINIISAISAIGVAFGSMALVIVLSVFNGFESMILSMFNSFTPDLLIEAERGKIFHKDSLALDEISGSDGIIYYSEILMDNALIKYDNRQDIVQVKGVRFDYQKMHQLDTLIIDGMFSLGDTNNPEAVIGQGVADRIAVSVDDFFEPIQVFAPERTKKVVLNPQKSFRRKNIIASSVFSAHPELDDQIMIVPLTFAEDLFGIESQYSAIELKVDPDKNIDKVRLEVESIAGPKFKVKTRREQQGLLYKILQSEKWAIFMILSFILLIAIFSHVGSLTLLILEKRKDIRTLSFMGASLKMIKKIFFTEGMIIIMVGLILGILLGTSISWLQQSYELLMISSPDGMSLQPYPVRVKFSDILLIFTIVLIIGLITSYFPLRKIKNEY